MKKEMKKEEVPRHTNVKDDDKKVDTTCTSYIRSFFQFVLIVYDKTTV